MASRYGRPNDGGDGRADLDVNVPFPTLVNRRVGVFDDITKIYRCPCTKKDCIAIHRSRHEMITTKCGAEDYNGYPLYSLFVERKC